MMTLLVWLLRLLVVPSRPKPELEAENAALKQQLAILQRKLRGRVSKSYAGFWVTRLIRRRGEPAFQ
jgi:hypothetical protein